MTTAKVEIFGTDGFYACVHGDGAGAEGIRMVSDPQGIYDSPVKVTYKQGAFEVGGRPGKTTRAYRELMLGLASVSNTPAGWALLDSAIRGAFDYEVDPWDPAAVPARVAITGASSATRSLDVMLSEAPVMDMGQDPHGRRVSVLPVKLIAGQPDFYEPDWLGDEDHPAGWETTTAGSGTIWVRNPTDRPYRPTWIITGTGTATIPDLSWSGAKGARVPGVDFRTGRDDSARYLLLPHIDAATNGGGARVNGSPRLVPIEDFNGTNLVGLWPGQRIVWEIPPYTDWTELPVSATDVTGTFGILCRQPRHWSRPWALERLS